MEQFNFLENNWRNLDEFSGLSDHEREGIFGLLQAYIDDKGLTNEKFCEKIRNFDCERILQVVTEYFIVKKKWNSDSRNAFERGFSGFIKENEYAVIWQQALMRTRENLYTEPICSQFFLTRENLKHPLDYMLCREAMYKHMYRVATIENTGFASRKMEVFSIRSKQNLNIDANLCSIIENPYDDFIYEYYLVNWESGAQRDAIARIIDFTEVSSEELANLGIKGLYTHETCYGFVNEKTCIPVSLYEPGYSTVPCVNGIVFPVVDHDKEKKGVAMEGAEEKMLFYPENTNIAFAPKVYEELNEVGDEHIFEDDEEREFLRARKEEFVNSKINEDAMEYKLVTDNFNEATLWKKLHMFKDLRYVGTMQGFGKRTIEEKWRLYDGEEGLEREITLGAIKHSDMYTVAGTECDVMKSHARLKRYLSRSIGNPKNFYQDTIEDTVDIKDKLIFSDPGNFETSYYDRYVVNKKAGEYPRCEVICKSTSEGVSYTCNKLFGVFVRYDKLNELFVQNGEQVGNLQENLPFNCGEVIRNWIETIHYWMEIYEHDVILMKRETSSREAEKSVERSYDEEFQNLETMYLSSYFDENVGGVGGEGRGGVGGGVGGRGRGGGEDRISDEDDDDDDFGEGGGGGGGEKEDFESLGEEFGEFVEKKQKTEKTEETQQQYIQEPATTVFQRREHLENVRQDVHRAEISDAVRDFELGEIQQYDEILEANPNALLEECNQSYLSSRNFKLEDKFEYSYAFIVYAMFEVDIHEGNNWPLNNYQVPPNATNVLYLETHYSSDLEEEQEQEEHE